MMDVHPVDSGTAAFLKRSNIRRRSFSIMPEDSNGDWLSTISNIIGGADTSDGSKEQSRRASLGPGMWWPLNDDNCSDEVAYDVHVASHDTSDAAAGRQGQQSGHTLERMGSSSTLSSSALKPPPALGSVTYKGSVSSQLRSMGRSDNLNSNSGTFMHSNGSQSTLGGHPGYAPVLTHSFSDTSDVSVSSTVYPGRLHHTSSMANMNIQSAGIQLADVTMKTESGVITRSVKSISLRLLVNRLASPEGNVDSDLMTDFLNSYRFFAHPIDVMRLIIVRYLNCFVVGPDSDESESSDSEEGDCSTHEGDDKYLIINGWRKTNVSDNGTPTSKGTPNLAKKTFTQRLPGLARNDGAIIQLRVMNIIKYWIKFHPHDFRLHHRLTRLLLLFLSHIQKQPGRAEFVNAIRQKLSSGKLLALEMPAFANSSAAHILVHPTTVLSQASSVRSSGVCTPTLESARSALDLQSVGSPRGSALANGGMMARSDLTSISESMGSPGNRPFRGAAGLSVSRSVGNIHGSLSMTNVNSTPRLGADGGSGPPASPAPSARPPNVKKGSASYFKSLFHHRSNKGSASSVDVTSSNDYENFDGLSISGSARAGLRGAPGNSSSGSEFDAAADHDESLPRLPNGDMYASDFGQVVIEALAKSGIPTPQTPVGRTLLNYSIANRNPYRINLVGIDPATFAEQLTLLEHELFSRIGATEFSLKGRVGNLETILHTMQGVGNSTGDTALMPGGSSQANSGPANPVPNLTAMTSWFNQATYWAVLSVLSEPTTAARALVIKQLVHVAFHCLARRNYYGAFEIVIALDNSAVRRLHETWALIPTIMKDIVDKILQVLQSRMNFRTYRESIKAAISGASGPDEEVFESIADQIKSMRAKDMISVSLANIVTSNGLSSTTATGHSSSSSGFGHLVHGAMFNGVADEGKPLSRKKMSASGNSSSSKDTSALLTEQDCACIMYAVRIRAASFMFIDPSANGGDSNSSGNPNAHTSAPVSSSAKGGRGSGGHMSSGSSKLHSGLTMGNSSNSGGGGSSGASASGAGDTGDSRGRRARSTSNSSNGAAGGKSGGSYKHGRQIANGAPLPLVPFVAVHMTDFLHADEANPTYSDEHQKMRSRNPIGLDADPRLEQSSRRHMRCDSTAISSVNQGQPLLNMQKFRLITAMFRELHMAQRTKYPYASDMMMQQQIHSAVRNVRAQTNDMFSVIHNVAFEYSALTQPLTSCPSPFTRNRTESMTSHSGAHDASDIGNNDGSNQGVFGYPLYQIAALQKSQGSASLADASLDWDCSDTKDNQELEQHLYMLSKWIEPASGAATKSSAR
ncbi:cell division cycle- protein [Kickxella alabastrina]|nr:cell division cycle- protein [Kickxella alabastrina]